MKISNLYQINGVPLLTPDADVVMNWEDLDSQDAGRDESGYMHRMVARHKVCTWEFNYSHLTQQEYSYMLQILNCPETFWFTYPDPEDPNYRQETEAYLSRYGITWHNAKTGHYRNLKFSIIEC